MDAITYPSNQVNSHMIQLGAHKPSMKGVNPQLVFALVSSSGIQETVCSRISMFGAISIILHGVHRQ